MSESQILHIHKYRYPDDSLRGIKIRNADGPPKVTGVSTQFADAGESEGWLTRVNPQVANAPGGSAEKPLRVVHTFVTADELVFHTVDGDVRYRVTRNPGKYLDGKTTEVAGDPNAEVFYDYRLELIEEES